MRSKTRSFPSLSLSPDSFLRSPYLIWQRKWTNKSEVERETLSPSPERIATRDSLSPLSLFSFKQRLTHGGLGFRILPYVKMFLRLPSFLSLCRHWRHFVHPIDCDVTLVLARTTAALTNITSSSGAPRPPRAPAPPPSSCRESLHPFGSRTRPLVVLRAEWCPWPRPPSRCRRA